MRGDSKLCSGGRRRALNHYRKQKKKKKQPEARSQCQASLSSSTIIRNSAETTNNNNIKSDNSDVADSQLLPESELLVCGREMEPLYECGDTAGMIALLARVHEVPEHWLCRLAIHAAVSNNTALLAAVVRRPFCSAHVTQQLRSSHSPLDCVRLADGVLKLFETQLAGSVETGDDGDVYDLADVVMAWTGSVLDAHYVWMVTSESDAVAEFLQRFADWQDRQEMSVTESLKTITLLDEMVSRKANHKPPPSGYCVETVVL